MRGYVLLAVLALLSGMSVAKEKVSWDVQHLDIQIEQGQSQTVDVKLYNLPEVEGAKLHIVPELQPWISVQPSVIENTDVLEHELTLVVSVKDDSPIGSFEGVLQVRELKAGKPKNVLPTPLSIFLTISEGNPLLPPDPGSENDKTLAGIDSDSDGVRDDIQRYIVLNYGDDEAMMLALLQAGRVNQLKLLNSASKEASRRTAGLAMRVVECTDFVGGRAAWKAYKKLIAMQVNTRQRSKAYDAYHVHLAGSVGKTNKGDGSGSCDFDAKSLVGGQ